MQYGHRIGIPEGVILLGICVICIPFFVDRDFLRKGLYLAAKLSPPSISILRCFIWSKYCARGGGALYFLVIGSLNIHFIISVLFIMILYTVTFWLQSARAPGVCEIRMCPSSPLTLTVLGRVARPRQPASRIAGIVPVFATEPMRKWSWIFL